MKKTIITALMLSLLLGGCSGGSGDFKPDASRLRRTSEKATETVGETKAEDVAKENPESETSEDSNKKAAPEENATEENKSEDVSETADNKDKEEGNPTESGPASDSMSESEGVSVNKAAEADAKGESAEEKQSKPKEKKKTKKKNTQSKTDTAVTDTVAQQSAEQQSVTQGRVEIGRAFIEDCGSDSGYWDITYSDGTHEYIDVP